MPYPRNLDDTVVVKDITPELTTLSCPFGRVVVEIGARAAVIKAKFTDGPGIILVSPIPICDKSVNALQNLSVKYLIAPNMVHYMALREWKEKYPAAKIVGCKSLSSVKLKALGIACDIEISDFDKILTAKELNMTDIADEEELKLIVIGGHQNRELVTFHGKSKTIVVGDLIFNLPPTEQYSLSKLGFLDRALYATGVGSYLQSKIPNMLFKNGE